MSPQPPLGLWFRPLPVRFPQPSQTLPMPLYPQSRRSMPLCALVLPWALASGVGVLMPTPDPISSLLSLPSLPAATLCVHQKPSLDLAGSFP